MTGTTDCPHNTENSQTTTDRESTTNFTHNTMYSTRCTVHDVQYTMYSTQCTVHYSLCVALSTPGYLTFFQNNNIFLKAIT